MNNEPIVAAWGENGTVQIFNLREKYNSLKNNETKKFVSKKKLKCTELV